MIKLRAWQKEFYDGYKRLNKDRFLLMAFPGGGKTIAGLYITLEELREDLIDYVIVVVPSTKLKQQWLGIAHRFFNIQLYPDYDGGMIKPDYNGVVFTYQKMPHIANKLNNICNNYKTLVIFDEVHHIGKSKSWGDASDIGFSKATKILSMTGTPFRSDNNPIPFVSYDVNKTAIIDYTYGYGDAIEDGVCRILEFYALEGGGDYNHNGIDKTFDTLEDEDANLKAILSDPQSRYLKDMLTKAHRKLLDLRQKGFVNAGGLIVTMDKEHANNVAKVMSLITGENVVVVHSDVPESNDIIETFAKSNDKWLVSVKMVSEGIDIPRLMVGVYATNILSRLSFQQIIGRVIRQINDKDKFAYFFVPKYPTLVKYMEEIKKIISHRLKEKGKSTGDGPGSESIIIPMGTTREEELDSLIVGDENYNLLETIKNNDYIKNELGFQLTNSEVAKMMLQVEKTIHNRLKSSNGPNNDKVVKNDNKTIPTISVSEQEDKLRKQCHDSVKKLAGIRGGVTGITSKEQKGRIIQSIHLQWKNQPGNNAQGDASVSELKRKLQWLTNQIDMERTHG